MRARHRRRRDLPRVVGLTVVVLLLASCTAVSAANKTREALTDRGFSDVSVQPQPMSDATVLRVTYTTSAADVSALTTEYADVAKIVWQSAPMQFDAVNISAKGAPSGCAPNCAARFDRAMLVAAHGPRDPDLDKDARSELLGAASVLLVLLAAGLVVTAILLTRSRRRAPRPWAYTPPGWTPRPGTAPRIGPSPPGMPPPPVGYAPPPPPPAAGRAMAEQAAWPPRTPPPAYEPPPTPLVVPTHDIWARPPS